ncbi:MAG: hypothetical protein DWG76_03660 [Chloroflexi bacterium]|nr:hypothetical protein [Chloroflexota bacterium]MQC26531.1 hypothetical protein [Chloroflexota bacterium]
MRWALSIGTAWVIFALYLDGFAHISEWVESFFTWYHLILYSGIFVPSAVLVLIGLGNLRRGFPLRRMLPRPYMLALLGSAIFLVGGFVDMGWRGVFGFEEDIEALLSPSHLFLAVGGLLIFNAPILEFLSIRPADRPKAKQSLLPVWIAWFGNLAFISFFTQYTTPFNHPNLFVGGRPFGEQFIWDIGLLSLVIWESVLLVSFMLLSLRYWKWPRGYFTVNLTLHALILWLSYWNTPVRQYWLVLPGALLAGIIVDLVYSRLQPSYATQAARVALRRFAFLIPFIVFSIYFAILVQAYGVWWQVHMWLGAPFTAGFIGWMLSLVAAPPAITDNADG